nr:hypothetical protein [Cytophagales bacterium]
MAFTSAAALGFFGAKSVTAQDTVVATIILSSAIMTTDVSDLDFGTYLVQLDTANGDVLDLTMSATGPVAVVLSGTATSSGNSQALQIVAPTTRGVVNVQTPGASTLQMTRSSEVAFGNAAITLNSVSYQTASQNGALGVAATVPITVTMAATDEAVNFGGVIRINGATGQPPDATYTASFDVGFAY